MLLKLVYHRPGGDSVDLQVDVDPATTVDELARRLLDGDPARPSAPVASITLRVDGRGVPHTLAPNATVGDSALRSGDVVTVVTAEGAFVDAHDARAAAATLVVTDGPGAGQRFSLRVGANEVGRAPDCDVRLPDPLVSKRHARVNITDGIEVIDLGSANGLYVGDELVQRANLRSGERVSLGDTTLVVEHHAAAAAVEVGNALLFNRSPHLDPRYGGVELPAPKPPARPQPQSFPVLTMLAPLLLGVVMFAFTRQLISVVFIALSPLLMAGTYVQQRLTDRRNLRTATAAFRQELAGLATQLDGELAVEGEARRHEHPDTPTVLAAALRRSELLWARRPDRRGFLELRLGAATLASRSSVELPDLGDALPELSAELVAVLDARKTVADVPLAVALREVGVVGVAGRMAFAVPAARSLLVQVAGLHSPAEVAIAALVPDERRAAWDWLKWLPHTEARHSPLDSASVGVGGGGGLVTATALRDLVAVRTDDGGDGDDSPVRSHPEVVVVVDDDVPVDRSVLVDVAERGPAVGVYVLWIASQVERIPSRAQAFVAESHVAGEAEVGLVGDGTRIVPVVPDLVSDADIVSFARALAPVVDAGSALDDAAELPTRVSLVDRLGLEVARDPVAVVERWRASDSIPEAAGAATDGGSQRRRRRQPLHALVGATAHENMTLDLRAQGPHALVGGTTGSGKSEFLQSWVCGLAANHSPHRVTFLFVDYKGGAAFSECVRLPHCVGLVTDLTPHLVQRALRSLKAELRHREHVLNRKRAKDVIELEERGDPECPPSLVIVVDEFAALVSEVPEFVDGVVDVAQRGRSLGIHLVLATQRPAGVIRDNLRANTNLRVALRMADEADSDDVVGSAIAAGFDPSVPGRGVVKAGPRRLTSFQSAYVGGWTTGEEPAPPTVIGELGLSGVRTWESSTPVDDGEDTRDPGPNDLHRLVESMRGAATQVDIGEPRKPWLPELAEAYDLARLPQSRTDTDLVFAVLDDPDAQLQRTASFLPDVDGNMAVIGTGGSGKSTFLRSLAVSAGLSTRGGPCHVYGLDFGSRGLHLLEPLPHVGSIISADDEERIGRLLRSIRQTIDERALRYAAVQAGSIAEYRERAQAPDEPRIVLILDGFAAFRSEYEVGPRSRLFDLLNGIAMDGRQVGVHLVISADRPASIPSSLGSMIQRRLVLRLASESDYTMSGVPADALVAAPPGRGFVDGYEVQVAVLGGSGNTASQAAAVQALAARMVDQIDRPPATPIGRLPDLVRLADLPLDDDAGLAVIGVGDETLGPFGVSLDDPLLVAGPPASGKSTALATLAEVTRRCRPGVRTVLLAAGPSPAATLGSWDRVVVGADDIEAAARALLAELAADEAGQPLALFVDDLGELVSSPADSALQDLFKAVRRASGTLVAAGETSTLGGSWPVLQAVKVARHGVALAPDQFDGDSLFKTPFPRTNRADFPPGRGLFARRGTVTRIQVAMPSEPGGLGDRSLAGTGSTPPSQ